MLKNDQHIAVDKKNELTLDIKGKQACANTIVVLVL